MFDRLPPGNNNRKVYLEPLIQINDLNSDTLLFQPAKIGACNEHYDVL